MVPLTGEAESEGYSPKREMNNKPVHESPLVRAAGAKCKRNSRVGPWGRPTVLKGVKGGASEGEHLEAREGTYWETERSPFPGRTKKGVGGRCRQDSLLLRRSLNSSGSVFKEFSSAPGWKKRAGELCLEWCRKVCQQGNTWLVFGENVEKRRARSPKDLD